MRALSLDALLRSLKQGPLDPIYYLHGDEDVLKDEALRALSDAAVEPSTRDFNLDQRTAAELDADALHTLVNTPPMLAERRLVVLRGVEQLRKKSRAREALLRYLAGPSPTTVLVLIQGPGDEADAELSAHATSVELGRLPPERVLRWIAHRAKGLDLVLEPEAAELLARATDYDLTALAQELAKLAGLAVGRAVTGVDVAALVGVRHGETLYDLLDAALERRAADAARLVEPVLGQAGMSGVRIVTALGTALVGTALARAELDAGTPRARLAAVVFRHLLERRPYGLRPWKEEADRWARWAILWSAAELRRGLGHALTADRALKETTITDEGGIVLGLVLTLAVEAREAA